ncbi:hypothetical protein WJX72_000944 [[Myrmecia] bisecta]|uniref:Aquaporin n=1 Tax=[Myrmecia] bisecta TaxID=41462 RepID=A0AAW1R4Y6_9CHLO
MGRALLAEFVGTVLFVFYSSLPTTSSFMIGAAYAALVFAVVHVSGGQLNPAVSIAAVFSGHMHFVTGGLYILAQLLGAVAGALLEVAMVPGVGLGHSGSSPGCFYKGGGVNGVELFLWEVVMTATFIIVLYGVAVALPGHGSLGPVALGFATYALSKAGRIYTGAAFNPARVLGPAFVFLCSWPVIWIYLLAQVLGAVAGAFIACILYETGLGYGRHAVHGEEGTRETLISDGIREPV